MTVYLGRRDVTAWASVLFAAALPIAAGVAIASGGTLRLLAVGSAIATSVAIGLWMLSRRVGLGFVSVEAPLLLLLASGLVFRVRDAESLATNPLDAAGLFRVLCVGTALLLGFLALTTEGAYRGPVTTRPFRLYVAYVAVVFAGAFLSINPILTAYRGIELVAGVVVLAGAYRTFGLEAMRRMEGVIFWWIALLVLLAWVGVVLYPGDAFSEITRSPIPLQLHGVFPVISSNGLGTLGLTLMVWALGQQVFPAEIRHANRWISYVLTTLGLATLIMAQYRTGYLAALVCLLLLLGLRSRIALVWALSGIMIAALLWGAYVLTEAEPVLLRGQSREEAAQLSSRLTFWEAAIPVWQESPWFGRGLLTGSRFEVLAELGRTTTSTIHGTWIEALVGTGLVGTTMLACAVVVTMWRAAREGLRAAGRVVPILLLTLFLVRSVTGTTFEVPGLFSILLLVFALSLGDPMPSTHRVAPWDMVSKQ